MNCCLVVAQDHYEKGKVSLWLCYADKDGHGEIKLEQKFDDEQSARLEANRIAEAADIDVVPPESYGLARMFNLGWPE